ncbi:MAG: Ig-like domain-containing protein [Sulfurimonas sp.]|jgi:hypothetical protein
MKFFNLFLFLLLLHIFGSLLSAVTLDTDTFDSTTDSWGGTNVTQESGKLRIDRDDTASKTFTFVGYENQTVDFSLDAIEIDTWESTDYLEIRVDGTLVFLNDTIDGTETKTFSATLNGSGSTTITITPNTNANAEDIYIDNIQISGVLVTPSLAISPTTLSTTEGNSGTTNAAYTVTLSATPTNTVTVNYATAGSGTNPATSGTDFTATSGTLTFASGTTTLTQTINVPIIGDTVVENNETYTLTLSSATNATITTAIATGTITNDDTPLLNLTKTASATLVNQSTAMSYTLTTTNSAATNSTGVTIADTLPSGMGYISSSGSGWTCSSVGSPVVLTCAMSQLAAGASSTLTLNVTAPTSSTSGTVTFVNTATVTDANLTTSTSSATVTLNRLPVGTNDSVSTASHTAISGNVLSNDTDLDNDTLTVLNAGTYTLSYGALVINANGSYTYTPGYFTGETDHYTYTLSDSHGATATATLNISIGSACTDTGLVNAERNFCLRKQTVLFGDMVTVGNTIVVPPTTQSLSGGKTYANYCSAYTNGTFLTDQANTDNQALYLCSYKPDSYINATSAQVITSSNAKIKWAGLYLQSVVRQTDAASLSSMDVKIKNGSSAYVSAGSPTVINHNSYVTTNSINYNNYSAFIDVTNILTSNSWKDGVFTVANVPVTTDTLVGGDSVIGKYGAWSLVIIYEDSTLPLKSVSVYDGWQRITGTDASSSANITVNNFYTPTSGTIDSEVSIFVAEGDKYRTGDSFKVGTTSLGTVGNAFDSSIVATGSRTPSLSNNQGIDIKTYQIGTSGLNLLSHSQSSIIFSLSTASPYDYFYPSMLAFSTEVYHPRMCYYENLYDANGLLTNGALVAKGSAIKAKVLLKNDMNEPAQKVMLYRTFDSTMPYTDGSTGYKLNPTGATTADKMLNATTSVTDALGAADVFDYSTPLSLFSLHAGTGATYNQGGDFNNSQTALFDYNTTADFDGNTSISYQIAYTMPTIGFRYEGELVKCEDFNNTFGVTPNDNIAAIGFDARETSIPQADDNRSITTKVVNKPYQINIVSLSTNGELAPYTGIENNRVYLFAVESTVCALPEADRLVAIASKPRDSYVTFNNNDSAHVSNNLTETVASKNKKIMMNFINWNQEFLDAAFSCSNSNTQAVLQGVPQCLNSNSKLAQVFPNLVTACLGGARPACESSSYAASGHPSPPYDNDFGCYQCLAGGAGAAVCSTDNFASRPNEFNSTITANQIFIAEQNSSITFKANKYTGTGTTDYNETVNASFAVDLNISDSNKICAVSSIHFVPNITFVNGLVTGNYALSNVGDFNVSIYEKIGSEFALIDADDTPDTTRLITPYQQQIKVIPDHFFIEGNLTNAGNGFTYFSNFKEHNDTLSRNMSASLDMNITAQGESDANLSNYTSQCYAKDGNITATLNNALNITPAGSLTKLLWYDSLHDINGSVPLSAATTYILNMVKTQFTNDTNGTATVKYLINFDRNQTFAANPLMLNIHNINYTDSDTAQGNQVLDKNATFIYGRTHAPRHRFNENDGNVSLYYEAYCDTNGNKTLLPNGTNSNITDDPRWFINANHTSVAGVAGTVMQKNNSLITVTTAPTGNHQDSVVIAYDGSKGNPYKATMENNASIWLIYNKYLPTATKNEFEVEFEGADSNWSGKHETNTTTIKSGTDKTNRRTMW